jgi:signal transduction histidine kinase
MPAAPIPLNENQRLAALERYAILDTLPEADFEHITQVAAGICQTPIALISLVASERQWFKAKVGTLLSETPREISFCAHTLTAEGPLFIVPDTLRDQRFSDNPIVHHDPFVRFYAGASLITPEGLRLGTLCVLDQQPRELTQVQQQALQALARQVIVLLELRLKNRELEQLDQFKNRLLSALSHDLRGALTQVQSLLIVAEGRSLQPEEIQPLLQRLQLSFDTSNELLHLLLRWAQSQLHGPQLHLAPLHLQSLITHMFAPIQQHLVDKQLTLICKVPPDLTWTTDEDILLLVLRNLLSNALKHTPRGEIKIWAEVNNGLYLHLEDTGKGMAPEQLAKLFQGPLYEPTTSSRSALGHGVGLLLCRDFVRSLGGDLSATSELGVGTRFSLYLPS